MTTSYLVELKERRLIGRIDGAAEMDREGRFVVAFEKSGIISLRRTTDLEAYATLYVPNSWRKTRAKGRIVGDGLYILITEEDGNDQHVVWIWRNYTDVDQLLVKSKKWIPRCLTVEERQRFALSPAAPSWCQNRAGIDSKLRQ
jgi:hypothetical protein